LLSAILVNSFGALVCHVLFGNIVGQQELVNKKLPNFYLSSDIGLR